MWKSGQEKGQPQPDTERGPQGRHREEPALSTRQEWANEGGEEPLIHTACILQGLSVTRNNEYRVLGSQQREAGVCTTRVVRADHTF